MSHIYLYRHFQTKRQSKFKTSEEKSETIKKNISGFKNQIEILSQALTTSACRYKIVHCVALKGKPFTDIEFIKETFSSSVDIIFNDMSNKDSHTF